jgi:hypothetical protein
MPAQAPDEPPMTVHQLGERGLVTPAQKTIEQPPIRPVGEKLGCDKLPQGLKGLVQRSRGSCAAVPWP